MPPTDVLAAVDHPFPGLRPFETGDSLLFFGREEHTQELLRRLAGGRRFLAVVGSSGSGKSSLVRAGLLPALYRGYLAGSTTHWRIAVMRPGSAPIENLCASLADRDALGEGDPGRRLEVLQSSSLGLVEVVRGANLKPGESLLIVADQFEELFRYPRQAGAGNDAADAASGAALFVSLLLQASERFDCPVYVVLTMRSEYLGDCSQFAGLPEALSRSQYLIPRLTREQRQQAIERPLQLAGIGITQPLVQRLLNDSSDEPASPGAGAIARGGMADPLPVLQHALMRICDHSKHTAAEGALDLPHYEAAGGIRALDLHAESIYEKLSPSGQAWAAKIFRCLTTTQAGRPVRRPTRLNSLYEIAGAASEADRSEVDAVLHSFLNRENCLLVSSSASGLKPDATIDIPHESLMWKWQRLQGWVRKEAVSAEWYIDLAGDAASFRRGESGPWRDPNLGRALDIQAAEGWNESWAAQYHPSIDSSYADALEFLRHSSKEQSKERWIRRISIGVALVAVVALLFYGRRVKVAEEGNWILRRQVSELKGQQEKAESDFQKFRSELAQKEALLAGVLSPEERRKLEKQLQELKDKAEQSQKMAEQLKHQQEQATKVAARGGTHQEIDKTLQERVYKWEAHAKTLETKLAEAQSLNQSLQDSFDTASREIGRLKLQLEQAIKERDAVKSKAAVPVPVTQAMAVAGTAPKPGTVRRNPLDGLDYVWIPPGEFQMGCSEGDKECSDNEKPLHRVQISNGFWMGQTEVTQNAYEKLMRENPSKFKGPQLPVERVSFDKAEQYCKAAGGRLPTEAEWEHAARAGSTAARYGELGAIAWYERNSRNSTHPVKQKLPNAWGLYDMLGSVWEWVADWYLDTYFGTLPPLATDPKGPPASIIHVKRGGSRISFPNEVRASVRTGFGLLGFMANSEPGFRCTQEVIP